MHEKIFNILITYSKIWKLAQNIDSSLANYTYKKMQFIIVELIYKFDGFSFINKKITEIEDEDLLVLLAWMMIPNFKNFSLGIFEKLLKSKSENIVFKAQYSLKNTENEIEMDKIKKIIDLNLKKLSR